MNLERKSYRHASLDLNICVLIHICIYNYIYTHIKVKSRRRWSEISCFLKHHFIFGRPMFLYGWMPSLFKLTVPVPN